MISLAIPGAGVYHLQHLLLDVNGTIALEGEPLEGVAERLAALREHLTVELVSADSRGRLAETARRLGIGCCRVKAGAPEAAQKAHRVRALGAVSVVAMGNGANDAEMVRVAALGIAILGPEGLGTLAQQAADLVVPSIRVGLDLLLHRHRLSSTLES